MDTKTRVPIKLNRPATPSGNAMFAFNLIIIKVLSGAIDGLVELYFVNNKVTHLIRAPLFVFDTRANLKK